jgi:hypothetical protein
MLNLRAFQNESLSFDNYYNHTFATYRGLISQLYSGYQLEDFDANSLISLQDIFAANGYQTAFINTEPNNTDFTKYLNNLRFDELVTDQSRSNAIADTISDKDAYDLLFETVQAQHATGTPFFTAIYTFGTHVSLDGIDATYGNGEDPLLNRFYNVDQQFGAFLEKFKNSDLFEDTILIFTTDHATYVDDDFLHTFSADSRTYAALDEIPLYVYYKGVQPESVDVNGRNSLNLTPTILDYLDLSGPNYFLGESLFAPQNEDFSYTTLFYDPSCYLNSVNSTITSLTSDEYIAFSDLLLRYFSAKGSVSLLENETSIPNKETFISAAVTDDATMMEISFVPDNTYENISFAVWSAEDDQDDLMWYPGELTADNSWQCSVPIADHSGPGMYYIHAYNMADVSNGFVAATLFVVPDSPQSDEAAYDVNAGYGVDAAA